MTQPTKEQIQEALSVVRVWIKYKQFNEEMTSVLKVCESALEQQGKE
jgi:hypothetical protein